MDTPLNSDVFLEELQKVVIECEPSCKVCYTFIIRLGQHIHAAHSSTPVVQENIFQCDMCDETYSSASDLQTHLGCHTPPTSQKAFATRTRHVENDAAETEDQRPRRNLRKRKSINYSEVAQPSSRLSKTPVLEVEMKPSTLPVPENNCNFFTFTEENIKNEPEEIETSVDTLAITPEDDALHYDDDNFENESMNTDSTDSGAESEKAKKPRKIAQSKKITHSLYNCKECRVGFANSDEMKLHIQNMHRNIFINIDTDKRKRRVWKNPFECKNCAKKFHSQVLLTQHNSVGGRCRKTRKCETCGLYFASNSLILHMKLHSGDKPFKCESCDKCYVSQTTLIQHKRIHEISICKFCYKAFERAELNAHYSKVHLGESEEVVDEDGNSGTTVEPSDPEAESTKSKKQREAPVARNKQNKCDECLEGFVKLDDMNLHSKNKHFGVKLDQCDNAKKPLECKSCHKYFPSPSLLTLHNSGRGRCRKVYKCFTCGKCFARKYNLILHIKLHTGDKPFKCESCDRCFVSQYALNVHKRTHVHKNDTSICKFCYKSFARAELNAHYFKDHLGEREEVGDEESPEHTAEPSSVPVRNSYVPGECGNCDEKFSSHKALMKHIMSIHKELIEKPYTCKICNTGFSKAFDLDTHFEQEHPTLSFLTYGCENCDKRFLYETQLTRHSVVHTEDRTYICEHCNKGFKALLYLERHIERSHLSPLENPHKCQTRNCNKSFSIEEDLRKHEKTHLAGKNYSCEHENCDESFRYESQLVAHTKTHDNPNSNRNDTTLEGEKYFLCSICTTDFCRTKTLTNHLRTRHKDIVGRNCVCRFCDKRFFSEKQVTVHIKQFHPEKNPFECPTCHREYCDKARFTAHVRIHTGEKPLACRQCDQTFRTTTQLKRHSQVHTEKKVYTCDQCTKSFTTGWSLSLHKRSHSGERSFMCDVCSKCFAKKSTLKAHMLIHNEENGVTVKPHKCKDCGKSFTQRATLFTHSKSHSGEKPHMCEECGNCFTLPHQLRAHLKTHECV